MNISTTTALIAAFVVKMPYTEYINQPKKGTKIVSPRKMSHENFTNPDIKLPISPVKQTVKCDLISRKAALHIQYGPFYVPTAYAPVSSSMLEAPSEFANCHKRETTLNTFMFICVTVIGARFTAELTSAHTLRCMCFFSTTKFIFASWDAYTAYQLWKMNQRLWCQNYSNRRLAEPSNNTYCHLEAFGDKIGESEPFKPNY